MIMSTSGAATAARIDLSPTRVPPARYRYLVPGTSRPQLPDLRADPRAEPRTRQADAAAGDDWIDVVPGTPFIGGSIGWRGLTVREQGVDIECEWDDDTFVDRFVLDGRVLADVHRIRVLVPVGERLRQVGQLDPTALTSDEFVLEQDPRVALDVGLRMRRCILRFETRLQDLSIVAGIDVVGVAVPALGLFPAPADAVDEGPGPAVADFAGR
ncbi:hypothetical protein [Microlunatus sp. Y2014]|uniref:hypothetical protein n=1 Tax=Microlunatus sp. Y2014 TaxID=3418488 RepID=UPI003DA71AFD